MGTGKATKDGDKTCEFCSHCRIIPRNYIYSSLDQASHVQNKREKLLCKNLISTAYNSSGSYFGDDLTLNIILPLDQVFSNGN